MTTAYMRAPHQGGAASPGVSSPHAALLIDFDNVTMGMRSDLSKELKTLLDSDVIKGKVSVQRAYADWRRYPQYIVPLSEASVDLIFAPAYGSNKKNATDIRMAIDGLELVFIRPEIGTYILLTGDSDFSSLVLKLKEYGKYVIGVGIQESSSDILVQNCDEYYSYTSLTGLTKTTDLKRGSGDPWVLVKDAVAKMVSRDDVMRSDRLKQVMQEIDPNFDEGSLGFSKFSKFLSEASSRGLVKLRKMDNGQYEIEPPTGGGGGRSGSAESDSGRGKRDRRGRGSGRRERKPKDDERAQESAEPAAADVSEDEVQGAIDTLVETLDRLAKDGRDSVRDSDVKRKILEKHPDFDEGTVGFPKFSKFIAEAERRGAIVVTKTESGSSEIGLPDATGSRPDQGAGQVATRSAEPPAPQAEVEASVQTPTAPDTLETTREASDPEVGPTVIEVQPPRRGDGRKLGPRRGSTRRRSSDEGGVPLFEGQTVPAPSPGKTEASASTSSPELQSTASSQPIEDRPRVGSSPTGGSGSAVDVKALGLPSDADAIVRYMAHRYKGVGEKTAEILVERFGTDVFTVLRDDPGAIRATVPGRRGEQVLEAWSGDYERRTASRADSGAKG
jgi:uncharacterized protein (TIGR00288 family)